MSEKEKRFLENLSKLPEPVKDQFLRDAQTAVMTLDVAKAWSQKEGEDVAARREGQ